MFHNFPFSIQGYYVKVFSAGVFILESVEMISLYNAVFLFLMELYTDLSISCVHPSPSKEDNRTV